MTKSSSKCPHFRCPDIERASKTRFDSEVLDPVMGIPTQAWITNYIALFYAIQLLMHVSTGFTNLFW